MHIQISSCTLWSIACNVKFEQMWRRSLVAMLNLLYGGHLTFLLVAGPSCIITGRWIFISEGI